MRAYPEYIDSGVEWIGQIPKWWESKKLKFLFDIKTGRDPSSVYVEQGGFKVLGTGGEIGRSSEHMYNGPSLILGRKGTIDNPFLVDEPFWVSDVVYYTIPKTEMGTNYLGYLSSLIPFQFFKYGSTLPSMAKDDYENISFPVPPLSEQKQISDYLDRKTLQIDNLIEKTERKIKLLEEQRSSMINECVTKGLDRNIEMKDSGVEWIGQIPCGWDIISLKYTTKKIGSGVTPRGGSEVYSESGIPFLRSQNIHFGGLSLKNVVYISDKIHKNMSGSKVQSGDVLINITGASIGRCCFISGPNEYNVNQHVCIVRPKKELETRFLNYFLSSQVGQIQVDLNITGSGREGLNFESLKNFLLPKVPLSEQKQISDFLDRKTTSIDQIIDTEIKRINLLQEYRQSLMFSVLTGKMLITEDMV